MASGLVGVDIGGTGIKAAPVDIATGELAAGRIRQKCAHRLQVYLELVQTVLWPRLFIIGGGISNVADQLLPLIELRTPIVPARLRNHAWIIGAALLTPKGVATALDENSSRHPITELL